MHVKKSMSVVHLQAIYKFNFSGFGPRLYLNVWSINNFLAHSVFNSTWLQDNEWSLWMLCSTHFYHRYFFFIMIKKQKLTEFTSFEAIACEYFSETKASSAPAITSTGMSPTALTNDAASRDGSTVSDESLPISCSASSQPSTHNGAWFHNRKVKKFSTFKSDINFIYIQIYSSKTTIRSGIA